MRLRNTLIIYYVRFTRFIGTILLNVAEAISFHNRRVLAAESRRIRKEMLP